MGNVPRADDRITRNGMEEERSRKCVGLEQESCANVCGVLMFVSPRVGTTFWNSVHILVVTGIGIVGSGAVAWRMAEGYAAVWCVVLRMPAMALFADRA